MEEFLIPSTHGGLLRFFDRSPADPARTIDHFWVEIKLDNLSATARVYSTTGEYPARLFNEMARHWNGWKDELTWHSFEKDIVLRCRHDRLGHISIRVELRSGVMPSDWRAEATITTEAGQLERIARDAGQFFGSPR